MIFKALGDKRVRSDILVGLACAVAAGLAFPQTAQAYVDPSVMTYTIQALAGVAVALSAVLGVALRRTRHTLMDLFDLDDDFRKDAEPVVHRVDPETGAVQENESDIAALEKARRAEEKKNRPLSFPRRLAFGALAGVFVSYTLFVVAPFEVVGANGESLLFGIENIWMPMVLLAVAIAAVVALVLSALRGRAFQIGIALVTALGVCSWVQAMFLNGGLPHADGEAIFWGDYGKEIIISSIVWVALFVAAIVLAVRNRNLSRAVFVCVSVALILVQTVGLVSLGFKKPAEGAADSHSVTVTEEGVFDLSAKSNVLVFVLDMFDTAVMDEILNTHPEALEAYDGFTVYQDSVGSSVPTRYGVPFLLTGELPREGDSWETYVGERYKRSTFIADIAEAGYSVGVYSADVLNGLEDLAPYTVNMVDSRTQTEVDVLEQSIDWLGTMRALSRCALYRDMPWAAKAPLWFYTDEINCMMTGSVAKGRENKDYSTIPWRLDDHAFKEELEADRLELNDVGEKGAFRFIHLVGDHWPYILDENGNYGISDEVKQARGALHIVSEYLDQMRDLGIYNNATIIVTSDHGRWDMLDSPKVPLEHTTCPIMMVKPAGAYGTKAWVSKQQTGHADYPATVLAAMGADTSKYGRTVYEAPLSGRSRLFYRPYFNTAEDYLVREFVIEGNSLDVSSWKPTGREWDLR